MLTPSGKMIEKMSPTSKDAEFYADVESDVGFCLYCLFDYFFDKIHFRIFRIFNQMTTTLLIMYLFKIRQMQKIEQVMPDLSVILPAPENSYLIFKDTIY